MPQKPPYNNVAARKILLYFFRFAGIKLIASNVHKVLVEVLAFLLISLFFFCLFLTTMC